MIYSEIFDAMPSGVRNPIYQKLFDVLSGKDRGPKFSRLSDVDRRAILAIVRETKSGLPEYWSSREAPPLTGF
jgi:lysyl-tRNA synthetase class I